MEAVKALSAIGSPTENDRVADFEVVNALSNFFDDPCTFMTADARHGMFGVARRDMPIAVANAASSDSDSDFSFARIGQRQPFDRKSTVWLREDGGTNLAWHRDS
jgi:hypothetical protein